jgi:SNF2 family DNA or RNA helicase
MGKGGGCNPNSPKATSGKHVCNEKTGNWVLMSSKTGKEILGGGGGKPKSPSKKGKGVCDPSSPKASSGKHVCNEKTGNWVLKTSKVGKEVLATKPKSKSKSPQIKSKETLVVKSKSKSQQIVSKSKSSSPKTISQKPKSKSPKTISQKPKSPKASSPKTTSPTGVPDKLVLHFYHSLHQTVGDELESLMNYPFNYENDFDQDYEFDGEQMTIINLNSKYNVFLNSVKLLLKNRLKSIDAYWGNTKKTIYSNPTPPPAKIPGKLEYKLKQEIDDFEDFVVATAVQYDYDLQLMGHSGDTHFSVEELDKNYMDYVKYSIKALKPELESIIFKDSSGNETVLYNDGKSPSIKTISITKSKSPSIKPKSKSPSIKPISKSFSIPKSTTKSKSPSVKSPIIKFSKPISPKIKTKSMSNPSSVKTVSYQSSTKSTTPPQSLHKPKSPVKHVTIKATSPIKHVSKSPGGFKPISMSLPNIKAKVDVQPHQVRFAKAFMKMTDKPFDKYGGIAVHSLGSGKTMTAITTSQMYLEKYPNDKVIVITPASLITNFQKEMDKWGVKNKEKYNFFTYDGFKNNPVNCSDSLLIVDEAHNLRTEVKLDDAQKTKVGKTKQTAAGSKKVTMRKSGDNFVITGDFTKTTPLSIVQTAFPNYTIELTPTKFKITGKLTDKEALIDLFNHNSNFFLDGYTSTGGSGGDKEQNKNKGMKAADIINCAKKARFVLLLTGTPVVNDMYDIENLMAMIYKREPLTKYKFDKMNADAMAEYFKCAISMYSTLNNAEVKKDFPETKDHSIFIEMTPDYLEKYKIIEQNLVAQFGAVGFKEDKDITKFYNGLRQATTKIDNENSPKAQWIMNLLSKSKPKEKFVVFSHFKDAGVGLLSKLFDKAKISYRVISGEIPKAKRQEYVDEYNKNKIKVLIITKAGGEGLNLLETRGIVLIEPSWNETTSNQVIGRAVRYKSHITLPKEDQFVDIYKLYMLKPEEKKLMDKTLGKNTLPEVVEMLENKPGNDKPSIDIYLKAHSMEKQDKLDRFLDFFKSIPSFEDCYLKGDTVVKQEKLQGMTTKNLTIKDNVTFDFKTWGVGKDYVETLFKNVFKEYTIDGDDPYTVTVPGEQIVKLTNDNIAYFLKKFLDLKQGKPKITTKSNNPQIKANVAKLNLKSSLEAYIPDNDLEALNIIISSHKPIDDSKLKTIVTNNPFTKGAQVTGPIKNNIISYTTYIISVSPDEEKHEQNKKNLKQFTKDLQSMGLHPSFAILSNKKKVYANNLKNQYYW